MKTYILTMRRIDENEFGELLSETHFPVPFYSSLDIHELGKKLAERITVATLPYTYFEVMEIRIPVQTA